MKVLVVSWYFPPCNTMGALRIGKLAKYLRAEGHDIRVVCANDQPYPKTLAVEVPPDIVFDTPGRDVNALPKLVQRLRVALRGGGSAAPADGAPGPADGGAAGREAGPGLLRRVLLFYQQVTNIPDGMIGWLCPALAAGRRAMRDWRPDVVLASAPPFTTLLAGRFLAKRAKAPLVVEYRDRWVEDPYGHTPAFRRWVDRRLEDWCVRPAKAVVTVSRPWAADYEVRWGKPVSVAYNGFDPDEVVDAPGNTRFPADRLNILYTGILYPERRDPAPLFAALAAMGEARNDVAVHFYGANVDTLGPQIAEHGLEDVVFLHDAVPFRESLELQRAADVLLLLQWNNPLESGNVPGKLFEYIAARRPVLGIGYEGGVPAGILKERDAGRVLNDPARIADFLRPLIARKKADGALADLPAANLDGLSRPEQYANVVRALEAAQRG